MIFTYPNYVWRLPTVYHLIYKHYQCPFKITHHLVRIPLSFPFLSLNLTTYLILYFKPFPITSSPGPILLYLTFIHWLMKTLHCPPSQMSFP